MKELFSLFSVLLCFSGLSQRYLPCGTDMSVKRDHVLTDHELSRHSSAGTNTAITYVIPVVFHVLHGNGSENIADSQVRDAIKILNRDFAKKNPDTIDILPEFKDRAGSTGIQFALATRDTAGNCTNGINHYYDTNTDWNDDSPGVFAYTWDPQRYLNVYVVKTLLAGGREAAGYSHFPWTTDPGDKRDAIVIDHNYVGSIGSSSEYLSRVLTHEVGHWLGLFHVFGLNEVGAGCSEDDLIADTPPTAGYRHCPSISAPSNYQLCQQGVSENFQNYMDVSYCSKMFTKGQAERMRARLYSQHVGGRPYLWTDGNLLRTGVEDPTECDNDDLTAVLEDVSVFPNPSLGKIHVMFTLTGTADLEVIVSDVVGRKCARTGIQKLESGRHSYFFNEGGNLAAGIYFLAIHGLEQKLVKKVVVRGSLFYH